MDNKTNYDNLRERFLRDGAFEITHESERIRQHGKCVLVRHWKSQKRFNHTNER